MSPEIGVFYRPRESMRALARQYYRHGKGRARTLVKHGRSGAWRPALPFLWLLGEGLLLATSRWQPLAPWSVAAYVLATGAEAVRVGRREGPLAVPVVWAIFPVVHVALGAGFATGLVRYVVRPDWSDGERLAATETMPAEVAATY
jgi:succinoglycan biosynthesis protein ExoA